MRKYLITFLRWLACGVTFAWMVEFGSEKVLAMIGLLTVLMCLLILAWNPFAESSEVP